MTSRDLPMIGRSAPCPTGVPLSPMSPFAVASVVATVAVPVPSEEPHAVAITATMSNGARTVQRENLGFAQRPVMAMLDRS